MPTSSNAVAATKTGCGRPVVRQGTESGQATDKRSPGNETEEGRSSFDVR